MGEQLGFIGSAALLALMGTIVWRVWRAAQLARDEFGTLLCTGIMVMLVVQIFENVGMTMGIMPITGIPLPFVSYGGSALLTMFLSMGLVLSGLLTEASWRLTMLLPAPIALIALLAGLRLLPRSEREKDHNGYDIPGAVLGTASMLLLVFTVVQAPQAGWASARTLLSFLAVAVLLTVFVRVERRSPGPLIRLGVLRSGNQLVAS